MASSSSSSSVLIRLGRMALALVVVLALAFASVRALNMDQVQAIKDASPEEPNNLRLASRQAAVPNNNLIRFLFYNARALDHPNSGLFGYKRSSSALDALTGVTLGKRSGANEYLNLEPFYNRQFGLRSLPRMYDMRWGPFDAYDVPENN